MNVAERREANASSLAADWLSRFADALASGDIDAAAGLFLPDGMWRDVLAFTWTIRTHYGRAEIAAMLRDRLAATAPARFSIPPDRTPPRRVTRAGTACLEAILAFDTAVGRAHGVLRLVPAPDDPARVLAWTLSTSLQELRGHEEAYKRAGEPETTRDFGAKNWLDRRRDDEAYADRDPVVLIVGAGQAGLSLAARLRQLDVDTLIVDRLPRLGDNWRTRYHSLTLHNERFVNHLPYMPFPPTWPVYIPKDRLANWFESYADAMELNVWSGTGIAGGGYDDARGEWAIRLARADGSERTMRPRHVVFATGVSSIPVIPQLPGLDSFKGTAVHAGHFAGPEDWNGRNVLVVGTGTSGHDVAQELHAHGAHVTMIQRSKTYVVSLKEAQSVYAIYSEGIPFDDCDLLATAMPYPVLQRSYQMSTAKSREIDKPLLDALEARGFRLHFGEDETGFQMMYLRRGGGYYFNVGCSELIAAGGIGLMQYADIERFVPEGARLKDGRVVPADLIVLATGYRNQQDAVRVTLGDTIAGRIGPVWGFDDNGELRNMWRRTAQKGLWFTAGSLAQARIYSRYLALQIKAIEEGII
jgi:putative flavoprotein involved in K+ transport